MSGKTRLVVEGISALALAAALIGASCASPNGTGSPGTGGSHPSGGTTGNGTGTAGTTGNGTGTAGTTGNGAGTAGTTGNGTGTAGTTGNGTGTAGTTGNGTGTAGTTGAAGTTGSGGAGGAVVQKDCATKTKLMNPVLLDFESYNGMVTANNYAEAFGGATPNTGNAYTGIYAYPEVTGGPSPTLSILGGHPPSMWAGSESWHATSWGMGGGIWMGCADATAYKGISFWVRGSGGSGNFTFTLAMDSTSVPDSTGAGGGTCTDTTGTNCKPAQKTMIPLPTDWTQVSIMWADFTPGLSGTTTSMVTPNGDNITGFGWTVGLAYQADPTQPDAGVYVAVPADLRIDIDDIAFIQ
jgi:hypothetical protein